MNVDKLLANPRFRWESRTPPEPEVLERALAASPENLPRTYLRFLRRTNGGSGPNPFDPGPLEVWPAEELPDRNEQLGIAERAPGFFAFGGNGGEQVYLFDLRAPDGAPVCSFSRDGERPAEAASREFLRGAREHHARAHPTLTRRRSRAARVSRAR